MSVVGSVTQNQHLAVEGMQGVVERFMTLYQMLNKDNLHLLSLVYDENIIFQDPMHKVVGLEALTQYFSRLYQNVSHIRFDIQHVSQSVDEAALYWVMEYTHPKLNHGRMISVDGMTRLTFSHRVTLHRDYFDVGQMLYEHVPLMGYGIQLLKQRAAK